jgi:tetratricopeptide (TPR) repeat protein
MDSGKFFERLDELFKQDDPGAVESFMLKSLSELAHSRQNGSPECASIMNELASFYRGVSRYNESAEYFRRALDTLEQNGMNHSPQYAIILMNLAGMRRLLGQPAAAMEIFLKAKSMLEDAGHEHSYEYSSVLNNLSLAHQDAGEFEKACELASAALDYMRRSAGMEHEIATSLNNLANIRLRQEKIDAAETLVSEALEIYESMTEKNSHHAAALSTWASI